MDNPEFIPLLQQQILLSEEHVVHGFFGDALQREYVLQQQGKADLKLAQNAEELKQMTDQEIQDKIKEMFEGTEVPEQLTQFFNDKYDNALEELGKVLNQEQWK